MAYLHSHSILHSDLNPKNILFDENFFPKITGFKLHKESDKANKLTIRGTPDYIAPEIYLIPKSYDTSDVYSFALAVYYMITKKKPFEEIDKSTDIFNEVVKGGKRPEFEKEIPGCYRKHKKN